MSRKESTEKKQTAKKTSTRKPVQAKDTAPKPKKFPKRKYPVKQPQAPTGFFEKTIAQRTVAWKTGEYLNIVRWAAILPLLLMIVYFTFFMAGYSFTVLICWCLIGILLFYNIMHLLRNKYPKETKVAKRVVTILLCIGLLVYGVTEALIIRASFGDPGQSCDYVVVLGAKVRESGPSVSLMDRILAARDYLTEHPEVIAVVSGGKGEDEPMTEASCMYEELVKLGIDEERIWTEEKATSTWENLTFSLDLIEEKTGTRPEKIGLLSSEYHLFRAGLFADACGVESVGIPARTSRVSQLINHFMREVAGVWHYILLGGKYE